MKVLICGTEQVVPDNAKVNKPWIKVAPKVNQKIKQGDRISIHGREYVVTLIPLGNKWFMFAICLDDGCRWDSGHIIDYDDWSGFDVPSDWEK